MKSEHMGYLGVSYYVWDKGNTPSSSQNVPALKHGGGSVIVIGILHWDLDDLLLLKEP